MNQGTDNLSEKAGPAATAAGINSRTAGVVEGFRRIRHLVRKEFTHIFRNKQNFRLLLVAPILQLFMFGYACRLDVENVATVVVDLDRSTLSREITEAFSRSGYFHIVDHVNSYDHIDWFLITGKASLAILIPPDLERRIQGNRTAQIGILIDGVDTISAGTVSGYAQSILKRFALDIMNERTRRMQGLLYTSTIPRLIVPSFTDAGRAWFNPNLTSKEFFVPGTIVLILLALCVILTSSVLVREKETGTLEQLMVAPISRLELIVGKTIPCLII
jgi:ABC-2 type transport system permease protein